MKPVFKFQAHRRNTNLHSYYYREGDERFYKRIWAGICPPSERVGALIVCAEELSIRPPAHIYFVDKAQESATDNLLQRALDSKALYQIEQYYGNTKNSDFLRYLSYWKAERREKHLKTIEIQTAPNSDGNISFHIGLLRSRLAPNQKTLHLGESKLLPAAFQELSMSDVSTAKDTLHPLLAALGYVVAALDNYGEDWDREQPESAEMEYDIDDILNR